MTNFLDERLPPRFWDKVIPEPMSGCWLWFASTNKSGYGHLSMGRKLRRAHVVAYRALVGEYPAGLVIDHKCRVRCCVNPDHMEPVTNRENLMRGEGFAARNARATTCKRGHVFDEANTIIRRGHERECRACTNAAHRKRKARRRALSATTRQRT